MTLLLQNVYRTKAVGGSRFGHLRVLLHCVALRAGSTPGQHKPAVPPNNGSFLPPCQLSWDWDCHSFSDSWKRHGEENTPSSCRDWASPSNTFLLTSQHSWLASSRAMYSVMCVLVVCWAPSCLTQFLVQTLLLSESMCLYNMWHTHIVMRPVQALFSNILAWSTVSKDVGGESGYPVCSIEAPGSKQ